MIEQRLREALSEAAATADLRSVRPLSAPRGRSRARISRFVVIPAALVAAMSVGVFLLVRPAPPETTAASPVAYSLVQLSLAGADSWQDEVVVFLCGKNDAFPVCKERAATEDDRRRIRQVLESLPGVESVKFESQMEAYERFRASNPRPNEEVTQKLLDVIKPTDLPESFRAKLKQGADHKAVVRGVEHLPGISNVVDSACIRDRSKC
ncbi:permease-like cell division protein FtsX [Microtetraspora malaysiensis]|uniref:permease-like cell division protein FtsX n=1 Tax=Microtetraspora malaysiensis TaxID=161358 RepID=UPI0008335546|nr:permease-like cell division protein FtsX [Microtetraspora malaysiensis]